MTFGHDTQRDLRGVAGLVNTLGGPDDEDRLRTRDDLVRFLDDFGWYGVRVGDDDELEAVRDLRPRLRGWWDLEETALVEVLNTTLAEAGALPQLVDHDGLGWHVHAVPHEAPLDRRMAVEAAMAFIDVVRAGELARLKTCEADDCDHVVVDLSRNRSKRFCDDGCGNRENVRAYRERQRDDSD